MTPRIALSLLLLLCGAAQAQIRLPGLPSLPLTVPRPDALRQQLDQTLAPTDLLGLRRERIDQLLRRHRRELARDPAGEPVLRGQLLAQPSDAAARARLLGLPGLQLIEETSLDDLDLRWLTLRSDGDLDAAVRRLRELDPAGRYDYHHVYLGSGDFAVPAASSASGPMPRPASQPAAGRLQVGLIDGGIDASHPSLRGLALQRQGCQGEVHASAHGTAVASLLAGQAGAFRGAAPGAALHAADIYCGTEADGGSVQRIAQALAWLVRERVAVINISLVGPANALLQQAVAGAQRRGHLIVAAVGNDGPTSPPLYPAAWPGVVAVSGVDSKRRALPEAGRGPHVQLCAPGSDMAAAAAGGSRYAPVRGTSFAAPLVAGLLAARLQAPDATQAAEAVASLSGEALDLGPPGRDDICGHGLVGEALRMDPAGLPLARQR